MMANSSDFAGTMITFGDYQTYYESGRLFKTSSSNISWIGSIQSLMLFAVGAVAGPIYDRGYLRTLLAIGSFGLVFGHMMLSLCTQYWQALLAQGFVVGIAGGCLFVPSLAVVQPYFRKRLGLALGIVSTGSSVGGVIYPVVFTKLIERVGFGWTIRAIGFVALGTLVVPLCFSRMRARPPVVRSFVDVSAFTDGPFMLCILACFLGYAGSFVAFFYTSFFGKENGWMSNELALYLVPILNAGSAVGRVFPNWLADKIGPTNVAIPGMYPHAALVPIMSSCLSGSRKFTNCLILGSLAIGVVLLTNIAVHNAAGVICTAVAFGLLSGIFVALPPLLFMVLTKDKRKLGSRMGMAYAMVGLAVLPGGPGSGAVLRHDAGRADWTAAWTFGGVLNLSAFAAFCTLRLWQGGAHLKAKM
jgi:MFS family permease